jgi:hypothetical protein
MSGSHIFQVVASVSHLCLDTESNIHSLVRDLKFYVLWYSYLILLHFQMDKPSALDATFMYQYPDLPESYHQSTPGIPHHPKFKGIAVVPGLVRISNRVFWLGG